MEVDGDGRWIPIEGGGRGGGDGCKLQQRLGWVVFWVRVAESGKLSVVSRTGSNAKHAAFGNSERRKVPWRENVLVSSSTIKVISSS